MPILALITTIITYETFIEKSSNLYNYWKKYWYSKENIKLLKDEAIQTD